MSEQSPGPGRRSMQSRRTALNATTVLAVLLPLLTGGALLLVRAEEPVRTAHAPEQTDLSAATVVCPSALPGSPAAQVTTAQVEAEGDLEVRGEDSDRVSVTQGRLTEVDSGEGPLVVTGEDDLAPGLVAGRSGTDPLAAAECGPVSPDIWITGVGAGAGHTSVLELVNPDAGPAVADVTLYGRAGVIDVPRLRGVSVPGGGSVRLDLARVIPRRDELALHVVTSRGRIGSFLLDRHDELGAGDSAVDWLPAQAAPSTSNVLLGLPGGEGKRTLVLANPAADEIRATVRIITGDSVFAPNGVEEIRLPPQSVKRISLTDVLAAAVQDGALGIVVEATAPITATLRSFVEGDLSHAVSGTRFSESSTVILPVGRKAAILSGAEQVGIATVVASASDGTELVSRRIDLSVGRGFLVKLPEQATLLTVTPRGTSLIGGVLVAGDGATVVRLRELLRSGLIPAVRPGLP